SRAFCDLFGQARQASSTSGAANAGLSHKVGSLTPGKEADITLIRTTDVNTAPGTNAVAAITAFAHAERSASCDPRCSAALNSCTLIHAPPARSHPVLHCPGVANHQDPVTTSHLPRGNPGFVDRWSRRTR
ncbi:MAG TPA: amidohydrolase family protein, partial [Streptosporangiaceae bacterium]